MPFQSKRQWRAAFAGRIPGISKEKAHEWAHETGAFSKLPSRAPAEKGKPTLRSKQAGMRGALHIGRRLRAQGYDPIGDMINLNAGTMKEPLDVLRREHRRRHDEKTAAALVELCTKIAMPRSLVAGAEKAMGVGKFKGVATANSLKPPGRAMSTQAINPRRNLRHAMTTFA